MGSAHFPQRHGLLDLQEDVHHPASPHWFCRIHLSFEQAQPWDAADCPGVLQFVRSLVLDQMDICLHSAFEMSQSSAWIINSAFQLAFYFCVIAHPVGSTLTCIPLDINSAFCGSSLELCEIVLRYWNSSCKWLLSLFFLVFFQIYCFQNTFVLNQLGIRKIKFRA